MAYVIPADFRTATLAEYAAGLALSTTEVASTGSDALLTATIARVSQMFNDYTNDVFESESLTLELDGDGTDRLMLPKRCTAVTTVKLRGTDGTLGSAQTSTVYRLHSSLYSTGSKRSGEFDWIDVVPLGSGLASGLEGPYAWPCGPQTVQVVGTFGWTTTPAAVKRAVSLMVYDHWKPTRADIRAAESVTNNNVIVRYALPDPENDIWTGISEVDGIIKQYRRDSSLVVA